MENKVILVTGAAKGIGAEIVKTFAQNKYDVIINYNKSEENAFKLEKLIKNNYNVGVMLVKADLTNESEIVDMYNKVIKKYKKIDIIVNFYFTDNGATIYSDYFSYNGIDKTKEEFMKVLDTNVVAPFLITKIFRNDVKTVINISSTDAVDTYNELSIDYCASKSALNSVTKTLSLAIPNITIVSLMLPWVNTEAIKEMDPIYLENELKRTSQKRLIEPNEVAEKIYDLVTKNNIKTGAIINWGEIYE